MTDLTSVAGVWKHVAPILKKWARHIELTEDEAWTLLNCFEDIAKPDSRPVPATASHRRERLRSVQPKSKDSLAVFSLALETYLFVEKDTRTIRRWCQRDLIPGAYQTTGGHWRVKWTPQGMLAVAKGIAGVTRLPKNLLRSRRWKNFEKKMRPVFSEYIPLLIDLDAELRGTATGDLQNKRPPEPTDEALRGLIALYQGGGREQMRYLKFRLEARRLYLAGKKLTFEALAKKVGISRRTMFRKYHQGAEEALNGAATPLTRDDSPEVDGETLYDEVVSHFSDEAEKGTASHRRQIPKKSESR